MMWTRRSGGVLLSAVAAVAVLSGGCGQAQNKAQKEPDKEKSGDHSGWWCPEHGVPEKECSICQDDVAKACKAKGDWCDRHDRAKSQCFKCDPTLREKFAAQYRAKYGKEPPPIEDDTDEKPKKESKE
jgi:hypothetical protein